MIGRENRLGNGTRSLAERSIGASERSDASIERSFDAKERSDAPKVCSDKPNERSDRTIERSLKDAERSHGREARSDESVEHSDDPSSRSDRSTKNWKIAFVQPILAFAIHVFCYKLLTAQTFFLTSTIVKGIFNRGYRYGWEGLQGHFQEHLNLRFRFGS